MKNLVRALFALLCSFEVMADSSYVSNPYQPYPPGCAKLPGVFSLDGYRGNAANIFKGEEEVLRVDRYDGQDVVETVFVGLTIFRVSCPAPDRSLIWLQFVLPKDLPDSTKARIRLPNAVVELPSGELVAMNLAEQPNLWGINSEADRSGVLLGPESPPPYPPYPVWGALEGSYFLLDNFPTGEGHSAMTASQYNGAFRLLLNSPSKFSVGSAFNVPATAELFARPTEAMPLAPETMPLSGRLSGLWVVPGQADQGFTVAVSSLPQPFQREFGSNREEMVLFLAHYTFDDQGNPMWLTGSVNFEPGTYQANIPMVMVSDGLFMGSRTAGREIVGTVHISSADDCNQLRINYEYSRLGLGSGAVTLQRKFSLETAGYECRDYEARLAAVND